MIVKNETANLDRCLTAVAPYIDCWVIGDTGSTDGTQDFITAFFAARNLPGELHSFPFHNFEQARNAGLDCAYASALDYDYLLLADADMELVVDKPDVLTGLDAAAYRVVQRTDSGLTYWNVRFLQRHAGARYRGVTHEYIDISGEVGELREVWYRDHATGSNRVDKFERDIRLLLGALEQEPENRRYWFYLAQSYRDAGRTIEAAEAYAKRAEMGGWDEEAWHARLQEARCLRTLDDEGGFLRQAITAFNQRPHRAEPLYDLARYYRERGMNDASVLFAEAGLTLPRPEQDILFVEGFVYGAGMREEFSIAANYSRDPARKSRGHAACNWLALGRDIPAGTRRLARSNLFFYVRSATALLPSFAARAIDFKPADNSGPLNPSVTCQRGQISLVMRSSNFAPSDDGRYETRNGEPARTRHFLVRLTDDLDVREVSEILPPADLPRPAVDTAVGLDDVRLFAWRDALWCNARVRELMPSGRSDRLLARLGDETAQTCRLTDWRILRPDGELPSDAAWIAQAENTRLRFILRCDPIRLIDDRANIIAEPAPPIAAEHFRGSSPAIPLDGGWLALVHEERLHGTAAQPCYLHRFVWFDATTMLRRVSRAFFFRKKGDEIAAGLAWHPDRAQLLLSFGVGNDEAWVATVDPDDVRRALEDAEHLPSGLPAASSDGGASPAVIASPAAETVHAEPPPFRARNVARAREAPMSTEEQFFELAPFLRAGLSPIERRARCVAFDAPIAASLGQRDATPLTRIHCFYEVMSDTATHRSLIAATSSMRAAGHPVTVWSYTPAKLDFLSASGVDVKLAEDVVPRRLFESIVARSEIRYFSDIFRYAVLYEHGGLWMDSDVVMLRPFPFRGDYFFNLQWRGGHFGHFVCGNVIYAKRYSTHLRKLYEMSIESFSGAGAKTFGDIGPKLLSDYVVSEDGAELRAWLFSPVFFNAIDWKEIDRFDEPLAELGDYLNDERVFGLHLWNATTNTSRRAADASLISRLLEPAIGFPSLTELADRFQTDKNRHTGNRHGYARIYDRLLASRRLSLRHLLEIELRPGGRGRDEIASSSIALWQTFFPFCRVVSVGLADLSNLHDDRFSSHVCDPSKREDLAAVAAAIAPASLDVIIDDGSHASLDQQMTLREFFPLLAGGGWYFIEDLDWQPAGEDPAKVTLTKQLLREIKEGGTASSLDPVGIAALADDIAEILFFDSHYELERATLLGGLAAIRKRGGSGLTS
jgi:glycosyltransferase involved in cell wall biosynthesis